MFGTWLLSILYAALALANIARGVLALMVDEVVGRQLFSVPLPVLGVIYLVCGLAFLLALIIIWRKLGAPPHSGGRRHASRIARAVAVGYQAVVWIIRLLWQRAAYVRSLWIRDALFSVLFLVVVFVVTHMTDFHGSRQR